MKIQNAEQRKVVLEYFISKHIILLSQSTKL